MGVFTMDGWEAYETMVEQLGAEELLNELARALSDSELLDNMAYIARAYGIELDEGEE